MMQKRNYLYALLTLSALLASQAYTNASDMPPPPIHTNHHATAKNQPRQNALTELFGNTLISATSSNINVSTLKGKTIGLYFSGHWCPPCRHFTPKLVDFYNKLQETGKPFEIVFVSADRDAKAMASYMKGSKMPWLAIPFGDPRIEKLNKKYQIKGVPALIVIDDHGHTLAYDARTDVVKLGDKALDKWLKSEK